MHGGRWSPACRRRPRVRSSAEDSATSDEDLLSDAGIDVDDVDLENVPAANNFRLSNKLTIHTPRMDTYRFSMANMEDSQDVELDAILGELCALEDKLEREMLPKSLSSHQGWSSHHHHQQQPTTKQSSHHQGGGGRHHHKAVGHARSNSGGGGRPKFEIGGLQQTESYCEEYLRSQRSDLSLRTESPDNDSAFSDNLSLLSSESSASSGGVRGGDGMSSQSSSMSLASSPTQVEQAARVKAEKIKIALEKMKEASIKKLFIKAFSVDNSAKSLLIDERMTVGHVCKLLAEKNHVTMDPKWALVEQIPELYIERVYEDHEHVVENLLLWTRDSCNRLFFLEKREKYNLFSNPQNYLLGCSSSEKNMELDDEVKSSILEEFFSSSNVGVPEVEGSLYLKSDGKKAWKKHFFVLRASGLYYCPKGKSKLSKDLLCLTTFDMNNIYLGFGWKKKYKAPTDFGFAVKHPQIQTKSSKYIKYLCVEDEKSLRQWIMGIRIAKYGSQLKENYDNLLRDMAEDDLETLAHARSCSVSSVAKPAVDIPSTSRHIPKTSKSLDFDDLDDEPPTTLERLHKLRVISRNDSIRSSKSNASGSSGCPSERSSTGTPTTDHLVFETDFPGGTIKRKPSITPKIPLTSTTRNLAKQSDDGPALDGIGTGGGTGSGGSSCNGSLNGSLGRSTCGRFSLRRSKTDDRILFGSLSRRSAKHTPQGTPPSTFLRDDLPLPPPPPEIMDAAECIGFDTLPPPPPEAFRNATLTFDAIPPPSFQNGSKNSPTEIDYNFPAIPPPASMTNSDTYRVPDKKVPSPAVPPKPKKNHIRRRQSESDARAPPVKLSEHRTSTSKENNTDLELYASPFDAQPHADTPPSPRCHKKGQRSRSGRRISAPCVPSNLSIPVDVGKPPGGENRKSRSKSKPCPPKRSDKTKLSSAPQRRSSSASAANPEEDPPESFLKNLQKVMVKKWKVAQQLTSESAVDQHQILGFRDPNRLPTSDNCPLQRSPSSPPPLPLHADQRIAKSKKHPPPPPPKPDGNRSPVW